MKNLDEIQDADAPRVGGKAFNCARLKRAGIAVPDGIVLTTDAMDGPLDVPELKEWLACLPPGTRLAVRSSATEEDSAGFSFAGMHATVLDVAPDAVADAVRACWASVASPQALAYRRARGLSAESPRTAVLIQTMVRAVSSGVAFTIDPITGGRDELMINGVRGLGEALVSGRVEPDEFRVRRSGEVASSRVVSVPPSLDAAQLRDLATLLVRIEQHYEVAQDVEWCHDGVQFWVVQSRPITTGRGGTTRDTEWTRANLREVLPDLPSHLTAVAVCDILNRSHEQFYGGLVAPASELGPVTALFCGRPYFNLDQMRHMCRLSGVAPAVALRYMGHEGEIGPDDEIARRPSLRAFLIVVPVMVRMLGREVTVRQRVRELVTFTQFVAEQLQAQDLGKLTEQELYEIIAASHERAVEGLPLVLFLLRVWMYEAMLQAICRRVGHPYAALAHPHLAAGEKSVSARQAFDLLRLARIARAQGGTTGGTFAERFDDFIRRYGHRGRYESDMALPRYREDPAPLLFAIQTHVEAPDCPDPDRIAKRQEQEREEAWTAFDARVHGWRRLAVLPVVRWLLRRTKQFYLWREMVRSEMIRVASAIRGHYLELAGRFVARGWLHARDDFFFLSLDEIGAATYDPARGTALGAIVERRKIEHARWRGLEMPLCLRESDLAAVQRGPRARPDDRDVRTLHGLCVSPGDAEGEVVVMRDPGEFSRMKRGAILVAPATDPAWTPLFTLASGVVVEVGGLLSHASTVAREYGLPAVANVKHATKILKDGERVRVDATNGLVIRLRDPVRRSSPR